MLTGFRTVLVGLAVAIGPAALTYFGGVDWTSLGLSPTAGGVIGAVIIGLRAITTTSIGTK